MITAGVRKLVAKSCSHCHQLKDAKCFSTMPGGYYTSHCHTCKNKTGKPAAIRNQQRSLRTAVRHRQPWTDADLRKLAEMASEGHTGPEIALALNRSVCAVYTMKNKKKEIA